MPVANVSFLKSELHDKGGRMTPQRETILKVFQDLPQGHHLSAEDLYHCLAAQGTPISLSTIYRNVKLMARMGILRELEFTETHKRYELNQSHPDHHHLICVKCYRTIEFQSKFATNIGVKTAQQEGYQLLDCQLSVHAICPQCQRALSS